MSVVAELVDALAVKLDTERPRSVHDAEVLARFVDELRAIPGNLEYRPAHPSRVRGLAYLAASFAASNSAADEPLYSAARTAAGWAAWSEYYATDDWSRTFVDRFANGDIVGPKATWRYDPLYVGLYVFGPSIVYPVHAHAAEEVYVVLAGEADFATGIDLAPARKAPGDVIVHPSNCPHEIRTGERPVFGVYAWRGDMRSPAWYREPMQDSCAELRHPIVIAR